MTEQLRIFIASSFEQRRTARRIERALREPGWFVEIWDKAFKFSKTYIESFEGVLDEADFAVVVLTGDDAALVRRIDAVLPRDNVIFELGGFVGRSGGSAASSSSMRDQERGLPRISRASMMSSSIPNVSPTVPTDLVFARPANVSSSRFASRFGANVPPYWQGLRYKPSPQVREDQVKLWRFSSRVAGNWWQAIERRDRTGREKTAPVLELSHVTLRCDPITNLPTLEGKMYDDKGKEAGSWRSVAVGAVLPDRRIYYQWEGEHDNPNFMNYGGQGTFAFDEMLSGAEGRFWKTDLHKARDGGRASTNDFRLIRCNPDEEETMRGPSKLHGTLLRRLMQQRARLLGSEAHS